MYYNKSNQKLKGNDDLKIEWKTCFRLGLSIFLLYLCIHYWGFIAGLAGAVFSAAFPLLLGIIIAYVINLPMAAFEKHYFPNHNTKFIQKTRRPVCMCASFITVIAVIALVMLLMIPQLVSCVMVIIKEFPVVFQKIVVFLEDRHILSEDIAVFLSSIDWQSRISEIISILTSGIGNVMSTVFSMITTIFSGAVTALLSTIFSIYLLADKDRLLRQINHLLDRYCKPQWTEKVRHVCDIINDCFRRFIIGQCTEAVILGALCSLGMTLLQFPYALMVGTLIGFTALIPVAGAYIGAGVGAFMILTVSPIKALLFLAFIVLLQQLEGNLIYPKVVGSSIGLPGIWVLAAVTIGGGIFGVVGMLFGVPIAAAAYRLLEEDVHKFDEPENSGKENDTETSSDTEAPPDLPASSNPPEAAVSAQSSK